MKNPFKKSSSELDLSGVGKVLTSGAAAGMAIASFAGKKGNIGGIIGSGFSLLLAGVIVAMEQGQIEDSTGNKK